MKIFSCIKPVPDSTSRLVFNEQKTWIRTNDVTFTASEADNYALEQALRLHEADPGEVIVLSVGGEEAAKVLRGGLAMGAERAIQVQVPAGSQPADEMIVASLLAAAIAKDGGGDVVFTGVQSDDLGSGATGVMVAEFLGWDHATVAIDVKKGNEEGTLHVRRELEGGAMETLAVAAPVVVTVQYGANQPRYASLKGIMAAKRKPFVAWTPSEAGAPSLSSLCDIKELVLPERPGRVQILSGTPEEAVTQLFEKLRKEARVL